MALKPTISLRQVQRLAITQQMQQSVAILAMSNTKLTEFLQQEQTENPLLDLKEPMMAMSSGASGHSATDVIENTLAARETMVSGLVRQLNACTIPPTVRTAAEWVVVNLNNQGLLDISLQEIAIAHDLANADLITALKIVQDFEPAGVAARSPVECIELQLKNDGTWSKDFAAFLNQLPTNQINVSKLASRLGLPKKQIAKMLDTIRNLPPNPSEGIAPEAIHHVLPDVIFQSKTNDTVRVFLNEDAFPKLRADSTYLDGSLTDSEEVKSYLESRLQRIHWLSRALEKRASTILRISIALSEKQHVFFKSGPKAMKPLTLQEVAKKLDIHQSTVSRAISGKFFLCDHGTFALRYLFSKAIEQSNGKNMSATVIRARIATIVGAEAPTNILSDTKIAEILKLEGITVARRTIAKYRGVMNIPTSSIRRIQKRTKQCF